MTDYWIDVDACQAIVNDLYGQLADLRSDFDRVPDHLEELRSSLNGPAENNEVERVSGQLDGALTDRIGTELPEHVDDMIAKVEHRINSMQEVINYYLSGDAEMAHRSQGKEDEMPQIYTETEYTRGHPATGYVDTPADPAIEGGYDETEPLTEDTAVSNPYEFASDHHWGSAPDGK